MTTHPAPHKQHLSCLPFAVHRPTQATQLQNRPDQPPATHLNAQRRPSYRQPLMPIRQQFFLPSGFLDLDAAITPRPR